jgi:branched-chain amino acid aminotransferase
VELVPIAEVDHRPVGTGEVGPITRRLSDLYGRVVRGQVPAYLHWCTPVYEGA